MAKRNATKTREKILNAACRILERDGFQSLGVNSLAAEAGIGKPLIYRYFGGLDGIIEALLARIQKDEAGKSAVGDGDIATGLIHYGRDLASDRLKRDFAVWEIADAGIRRNPDSHEPATSGEAVPSLSKQARFDAEAAKAILKAATHFLVLYRDRHDQWDGIPLATPKHMARLENALVQISDRIFTDKPA